MAEWAALPRDTLVLIANLVECFEDFCSFYAVCKSWHSVTSITGKSPNLPRRYPWIMLTDKAEINYPKVKRRMNAGVMLKDQVRKNEQIEGMYNRKFYSFSASKVYEFELPEATRRKCLGVGYGLLFTIDYDSQINILNPFTRQQIAMPSMLSFKTNYNYDDDDDEDGDGWSPQDVVHFFVRKVAMSSNPYKNREEDCIIMAIYGVSQVLGFARPGDQVWTDVCLPRDDTLYLDIVYYNGKFYAVDFNGILDVCDIYNDAKATTIACGPDKVGQDHKYLVESSGDLLLVVRSRKGPFYTNKNGPPYINYTVGFSIYKLVESCDSSSTSNGYPYKWTKVKSLGNKALFLGNNASVSVSASRCVKGNCIYFSEDEVVANFILPYGGGYDTGIYDVESGSITVHNVASKFKSHLTPPIWIVN